MSDSQIKTGRQIRQDFLDFFQSKRHSIVPSDNLGYQSRDGAKIFTNAGMNQFVPIFLGERKADVDKWPGAVTDENTVPTRAADTQKCIRAGGKHNDLDDVGLDTYHHTFFEMLGNWSFGDYFKKEAIEWAWELLTEVWKFPKERLYATVYKPGEGDPAEFDQEAYDIWAAIFKNAGLDPETHVVFGNKKDNFWMMGDTGPCGPCSELHIDLTQQGDTKGALVNKDSSECIEIWNLVFIQFNANADGTFSPLPARHVDTGMGFERVCSVVQNTKGFTDFKRGTSNYETDVFRPIFDKLEELSGKKYEATLPREGSTGHDEQEKIDVAFRVIADHIRTLTFSIADGLIPGNTDRNYTLRRILRRAVRYGRTLGFHEPFFYKLVDVLVAEMGDFFPELREKQDFATTTIKTEEVAFNKTLDRGMKLFEEAVAALDATKQLSGDAAFELYDTYGFPLDLTELMARERGLTIDHAGFDAEMAQQRARARAAQKKDVIEITDLGDVPATNFIGFDDLTTTTKVQEVVKLKDKTAVILETSPFYAEMGGQLGDSGEISHGDHIWRVANTQKAGDAFLHLLGDDAEGLVAGIEVEVSVDAERRAAIQRHHSVTHIFHWALHEVASKDATQKGSYVGPDKLTFDFNSAALTPRQLQDIEKLVNERIVENAIISWTEVPYTEARENAGITQLFGEKYGETVRVVQIGGKAGSLNGWSMELCGGTHTRATGEIGLFRIVGESAIAAGTRRIEAIAGLEAYAKARQEAELIVTLAGKVNSPIGELEKKLENLIAQQKQLEKQLKSMKQKQAGANAKELIAKATEIGGKLAIIENMGDEDGNYCQAIADALKGEFNGVVVLAGSGGGSVALVATVAKELTGSIRAGEIIKEIAPIVGGKGGGKPDQARGGGKDVSKVGEALEKARALLAG
ncbi:MAG: alanine--tRNA ligase [Verrucomicrobiia bacterium]|jgi:alanyl-tRNA synthetase